MRSLPVFLLLVAACDAAPTGPQPWSAPAQLTAATAAAPPAGAVPPPPAFWGGPIATDPAILTTDSVLQGRFLGEYPATSISSCPAGGLDPGWTVTPLMPGAGEPRLRRWCVYQRVQGTAPTPMAPSFLAAQNLTLHADHAAIAAQGLDAAVGDTLIDLTLKHGGALLDVPSGTAPSVRVAVIDSSPTLEPAAQPWNVLGSSGHGHGVANLVRELTCDGNNDCLAEVSTSLALPYVSPTAGTATIADATLSTTTGGDYGSFTTLAGAIWQAVQAHQVSGTTNNLVLNLSLGWHPRYGGLPGAPISSWPADVRAVFDAMSYARCSGAVPLVAAGNRLGGPSDGTGPLLPAGWTKMPIGAGNCNAVGVVGTGTPLASAPMVWSVGGQTQADDSLNISRPMSTPGLVAYASAASTFADDGSRVAPLTGTSAAAAIASATVAAVWQQDPSLLADGVMDEVRAHAAPRGDVEAAPNCLSGVCDPVVVLSTCEVLTSKCAGPGPACADYPPATLPECAPITVTPPNPAAFTAAATPWPTAPARWWSPTCGFIALRNTWAVPATDPCPVQQFHQAGAEPYVYPQPHLPDCPTCYLSTGTGELFLELDEDFSALSSVTLYLEDGLGRLVTYTTSTLPPTGNTTKFMLNPSVTAAAVNAAVASETATGDRVYAEVKTLP